jgi:hypothetical protein
VELHDANKGTFSYTVEGVSGSKPMTRLRFQVNPLRLTHGEVACTCRRVRSQPPQPTIQRLAFGQAVCIFNLTVVRAAFEAVIRTPGWRKSMCSGRLYFGADVDRAFRA